MADDRGPVQVARNEAAKQAVMLAFGIVGAFILLAMQRRMMGNHLEGMLPATVRDDLARERAAAAAKVEDRWHRIAVYCFRTDLLNVARWAHGRAERARAAREM